MTWLMPCRCPRTRCFPRALAAYFETVRRPEVRARSAALVRAGRQTRSPIEMELGIQVALDHGAGT